MPGRAVRKRLASTRASPRGPRPSSSDPLLRHQRDEGHELARKKLTRGVVVAVADRELPDAVEQFGSVIVDPGVKLVVAGNCLEDAFDAELIEGELFEVLLDLCEGIHRDVEIDLAMLPSEPEG